MIYTSSSYIPAIERRLQLATNNVSQWTTNHGFTISDDKTVAVHFNRQRGHTEPNIRINGRMIIFNQTATFLGMIFDQKLNWKPHIKSLKQSCMKRLSILRSISHTDWGADRVTMLRLYRALIRSELDYGSVIYASAKENVLKTLDPVHNAALRLCTGAFRSSPVPSIYAESGEPPLNVRRMQLSLQFFTHIELLPTSPTYETIHQRTPESQIAGTFAGMIHEICTDLQIININVLPIKFYDTP
uniref:RNA-directed DNA polymerase from mobile element jockey-like n=1 Tax=Hirondellea gigas TaxID=1518452 RepID=A0A2P2I4W4_9CRUS